MNAPGIVQLWKGGIWEQVAAPAISFEYLQALGNFLANISQKPFDEGDPILSAYLPGGERIEMTMPPTAARGMIYLNLRKHTSQSFELGQFVEQQYFAHTRHVHSAALAEDERTRLLRSTRARADRAVGACESRGLAVIPGAVGAKPPEPVVSGATGSGKTSFIRALIETDPALGAADHGGGHAGDAAAQPSELAGAVLSA